MTDRDIDEIFETPYEVDSVLLQRVSASMSDSLQPVRPVPPVATLAFKLLSISTIFAVAGAGWLGFFGLRKLGFAEMVSIFTALAIFTWFAALLSVAEMTPGSFRWKNPELMEPVMTIPGLLLLAIITIWVAVDAILFHDYEMGSFVPEGLSCLRAGLIVAISTGIGSWMILRDGFAVRPVAAGLAAGTLAGMAGLTMLELHCPNFRAMHIMVWHTAVVPVSGLVGAMVVAAVRKTRT